jgi:hypothetical protein
MEPLSRRTEEKNLKNVEGSASLSGQTKVASSETLLAPPDLHSWLLLVFLTYFCSENVSFSAISDEPVGLAHGTMGQISACIQHLTPRDR